MGATQSQNLGNKVFSAQEWQPILWEPYTNIKDPTFSSNFVVYAHRNNSNIEIEKYSLIFNSQAEYLSYLQTYYERCRFPSLVNGVYIEQTSRQGMCSTFHSAELYLERINLRLFELIEVPVDEGLYILDTALDGYQKMFSKTGYFDVSSDMIGVNKQGKVKVWVNKNFSKSLPDFNRIDHNKGQPQFVLHLVKVVEHCIDYSEGQIKFSQFLSSKKPSLSFLSMRNIIKQYQKAYSYPPVKTMKSILLWVKKTNISKSASNSRILQNNKSEISIPSQNMPNFQRNKNNNQIYNGNKIQFNKLKTRKFYKNKPNDKIKINIQNKQEIKDHQPNTNDIQTGKSDTNRIYTHSSGIVVTSKSFIQNDKTLMEIREIPTTDVSGIRLYGKNINKFPSVSFSYKNSGLFSPQNTDGRQNQWFRSSKRQSSNNRQRKKEMRNSLVLNIPQEQSSNTKVYYSNGYTHEIDSDILRDLNLISQKEK